MGVEPFATGRLLRKKGAVSHPRGQVPIRLGARGPFALTREARLVGRLTRGDLHSYPFDAPYRHPLAERQHGVGILQKPLKQVIQKDVAIDRYVGRGKELAKTLDVLVTTHLLSRERARVALVTLSLALGKQPLFLGRGMSVVTVGQRKPR